MPDKTKKGISYYPVSSEPHALSRIKQAEKMNISKT